MRWVGLGALGVIVAVVLLVGQASMRAAQRAAQVSGAASAPATLPAASAEPSATATALPTRLPTPLPATARPTRPPTPLPATTIPTVTAPTVTPAIVGGREYEAYIPAASKSSQAYHYSCEFDAAWVIFATFGLEVDVDDMVEAIGVDTRVEPYYQETRDGFIIHGGDITSSYSGDYKHNFLARTTGLAMRKVFTQFGFEARPVHDRAGLEQALRQGRLVWIKTTVDFKPWRPAIWRTPEGRSIRTVLGNDHAVVVIGFNAEGVLIRDVLGPTSSNWERPYEYEVSWEKFLAAWGAQENDGLAVAPLR
jgi:hypothetical protein